MPVSAVLQSCQKRITLPEVNAISIKLPPETLRQLKADARATGRTVAALIRERLERPAPDAGSVHALAADLAGSLAGSRRTATNARRKFLRR